MAFPTSRSGRRLVPWLALGLLAAAFLAGGSSPLVNFLADFNDASVQGPGSDKSFHVVGGTAVVHGPQDVYEVVFAQQPGDGELRMLENAGLEASAVDCELIVPATAKRIDVSWAMRYEGAPSPFDVRFDDVGNTGVLDVIFDDAGNVIVNGAPCALPLAAGETECAVHLTLETHVLGFKTWKLALSGPTANATYNGLLPVASLSLATLHIVREPLVGPGTGSVWFLDDLLVTSHDPVYGPFVPTGSMRK